MFAIYFIHTDPRCHEITRTLRTVIVLSTFISTLHFTYVVKQRRTKKKLVFRKGETRDQQPPLGLGSYKTKFCLELHVLLYHCAPVDCALLCLSSVYPLSVDDVVDVVL